MKGIEQLSGKDSTAERILFGFLGFYMLLLLSITVLVFSFFFTDGYVTVKRLVLFPGTILLSALFIFALFEIKGMVFHFRPAGLFLFGFMIASFFSLISAVNVYEGIRQCHQIIIFFLVYTIVAGTSSLFPGKRTAVLLLVLLGLIVSLYGAIQYFHLEYRFDLPLLGKPVSTLGNKNVAGQFIILVLPLSMSLIFIFRSLWNKFLFSAVTVVLLAYLVMTRSRSSWVGLAFALILTAIVLLWQTRGRSFRLFSPKEMTALILLLVLVSGFLIVSDSYLKRIVMADTHSLGDMGVKPNRFRLLTWQTTWDMFLQSPLTGVGAGNFQIMYPMFRSKEEMKLPGHTGRMVDYPHNDYLQAAGEAGIPGLLMFSCAVFTGVLSIAAAMSKNNYRRGDYILLAGGFCATTALAISALFNFPFQNPALGAVFWFIAGLTGRSWTSFQIVPGKIRFLRRRVIRILVLYVPLVLLCWWAAAAFSAPPRADFYLKKGLNRQWRQDSLAALAAVNQSVAIYPCLAEQHILLGWLYEEKHLRAHAIEAYEKALTLNPTHAMAYFFLGIIYAEQGQPERAIHLFKESIRFNPFFPKAHYSLGKVYEGTGRFTDAAGCYYRALALDSSIKEAHYALGNIYYRRGEYMTAAYEWKQFLAKDPDFFERDELQARIDNITAMLKERRDAAGK